MQLPMKIGIRIPRLKDFSMLCRLCRVLMKDLPRTRAKESYMQQPSFQKIVKRMGIFFCLQNNINYQQGLL